MVSVLLWLFACDRDGDGVLGGDCAPADATIGAVTWYADADGDGWGTGDGTATCTPGSGQVTTASDCDDADPTIWPGAPEVCDGVDQDCDGTIDNGAVDAPAWFSDADADGYGDPGAPAFACTAPADTVADARDCDDTDPAVWPGAPDTPYDGVDADCAADADDDVDADGAPLALDCDDADPTRHPGAADPCGDGRDTDCDGAPDTCTWAPADASARRWGTGADAGDEGAAAGVLTGSVLVADLAGGGPTAIVRGSDGIVGFATDLTGSGPATDTPWSWSLDCGGTLGSLAAADLDGDGVDELIVGYASGKGCGDTRAALVHLDAPAGGSVGQATRTATASPTSRSAARSCTARSRRTAPPAPRPSSTLRPPRAWRAASAPTVRSPGARTSTETACPTCSWRASACSGARSRTRP